MCLVDSAGGEESVLFKAQNQLSSPISALPDSLCPSHSSIRHELMAVMWDRSGSSVY